MLCGCTGLSTAAKAPADDTYSKDDSGVYTGGEDNMSLIKAPTAGQRRAVSTRGGSFLKSDQAYPGCFAWNNKGFGRRSMDDLDMYGGERPVVIQAAERSSLSDLKNAPSIPVMEATHDPSCGLHLQSQENLTWSSRMYQPYKGQLKLAVYLNCGLLTLHVKEARQLSSSYGAECNTFVKLSLSPDETKRTKCRTNVVAETDKPKFDEKFSFELLDGDMKKRLLISVWHKQNTHTHSELLGCMSFGVRHIVQKKSEVDGWYFLLSDAVGKRKHLQVGSQHHQKLNTSITHTSEGEDSERTDSNRLLLSDSERTDSNRLVLSDSSHDNMAEMLGVTVSKGPSGFGFQISGERPAYILKIQEDSTSAQVGLLPGDHIIKVDDHDVSNLSSDTVARILKQCQGNVILGIHRNKKPLDNLQKVIPKVPQNTQDNNSLLMNTKDIFLPSALPNKFKFDGMVKPASSQVREVRPVSPGSPTKERRVMMPSTSPVGGRRHLKPSSSPVVERRPLIKPGGSAVVDRQPMKPSGSPLADRRMMLDNGHRNSSNIVVSGSPLSGRRHGSSKKLPDYSDYTGNMSHEASNGLYGQRQRKSSPVRDKRYNGGSPIGSRRDVINVGEELRNGQKRGVVFTPMRMNGHDQGKVEQDYGNNVPIRHPEYLPNCRATHKGSMRNPAQYQSSDVPHDYQVHPTAVQLPINHDQHTGYSYGEYRDSENHRLIPNGRDDTVGNSVRGGRHYNGTNSSHESYDSSQLPFNTNSVPLKHSGTTTHVPNGTGNVTNHSGNTYVPNTAGNVTNDSGNTYVPHTTRNVTNNSGNTYFPYNAATVRNHSGNTYYPNTANNTMDHSSNIPNGQLSYATSNAPSDQQKRRIPTCDDSSSEDENFYVYAQTSTGVTSQQNGGHTQVQHQAVASSYQNNYYKVSSF